ncbi:MAG TPA: cohesin domain-containing protein [Patescibacteria group bacterium]|nr:cohesin domain-containing protein [Patescibacteria group bacterium]
MMRVKSKKLKVKSLVTPGQLAAVLFVIPFFLFTSHQASAATLYSQAANQDVYEGQTFEVDWFLDTTSQDINTISLTLNFSSTTLQVANISTGGSLINLWIAQPSADNDAGKITLTGGISNGIVGSKVPILRTTFLAKSAGSAFIQLDPSSKILLNDGTGNAAPLSFNNETFNIYPKDFIPIDVSSPSHPDQNAWYQNRDVKIQFTPKPQVNYSFILTSNPEVAPDNVATSVPAEIDYPSQPDGVYYFKLDSQTSNNAWQEGAVYRVQIDATPPEDFTPTIGSDPNIFAGNKFVSFSTVDKTSGISHYNVKFGWFRKQISTDKPYVEIPKFFFGNEIHITAIDNSGNSAQVAINYKILPAWIEYAILALAVLVLIWLLWFLTKRIKDKNEK